MKKRIRILFLALAIIAGCVIGGKVGYKLYKDSPKPHCKPESINGICVDEYNEEDLGYSPYGIHKPYKK